MSALDSWFLHVDDDVNHMHIGSVGVFEGPAPGFDDLRDALGAKLDLIPRYRQRYREVARGMARQVWVDDPHFELEYHVRHTALPRPGGEAELRRLVGRVMGQQLDRKRPLWETWFVDGLEGDRWAMVSKVHHCIVDGVAGTDLLATVLSSDPTYDPSDVPTGSGAPNGGPATDREPSSVALLGSVARNLAGVPARAVRAAAPAVRHSAHVADRRQAVKQALGGTVNDVVLAAITAGYRDLLAARGELDEDSVVRTLVPISLRRDDQRGDLHNLVSALFVSLPVTEEDPAERYRLVRASMDEVKHSGEQGMAELVALVP